MKSVFSLINIVIFGAKEMSEKNQQIDEEQNNDLVDNLDQEESVHSHDSRFSEDFQSDDEGEHQDKVKINNEEGVIQEEEIAVVKNPVSAYLMFVKNWKETHPNEKLNISMMGQIWKQLSETEKSIFEVKYKEEKVKYDEYITTMMARDPNFVKKKGQSNSKKFFFPLHRIKNIMKLDSTHTASTQNVSAMARATQYFGQFFLQQVKKTTEGKKRIDLGDFFQTINSNQSNLWFLNCLIDQHNTQNEPHRKVHPEKKEKVQKEKPDEIIIDKQVKKLKPRTSESKKKVQNLPKGQLRLTDMF